MSARAELAGDALENAGIPVNPTKKSFILSCPVLRGEIIAGGIIESFVFDENNNLYLYVSIPRLFGRPLLYLTFKSGRWVVVLDDRAFGEEWPVTLVIDARST